ncbi:MAG: gliding motility-associated C-terminal domain-containing protein [Flavobacteriales bacterium]|nr:gliding motility-associated C-terminal domain-containing protein [Flavobacteriales bacterium]
MFSSRTLPLLLIAFCLFAACRKETKGDGGAGIILGQHLQLSVDSLCVQAPNIFTPNGDGMNDVFVVIPRNDNAFSLIIRNEADSVVFSTSNWYHAWNGIDPTVNGSVPTAGRYHYFINVIGTSDAQLSGNYVIYVVTDPPRLVSAHRFHRCSAISSIRVNAGLSIRATMWFVCGEARGHS